MHVITKRRPPASGFALVGYLLIAIGLTALVWRSTTDSWVGGPGDPYKFMDFLAWIPHAISTGHNPLHMGVIDYPRGVNLAWETPVPVAGVLTWPFTATVGVVVAYNVWTAVALTLDGWCTYLWLRRHTRQAQSAFLGGLLLEMGPYVSAHVLGHLNLISFFPVPLVLLAFEQLLQSQRFKPWLALAIGVLLAVQFYLAEEILALVAIALVCGVVVATLTFWKEAVARLKTVVAGIIVAGLTLLVLTGPALFYQFFGPNRIHGLIHPPNIYVTNLANLVIPTDRTWLRPVGLSASQMASWSGNGSEQTGYIGLPLLALAIYGLVHWWRQPFVRVVAVTTMVLAILSLGSHLRIGGTDTGIRLPAVVFAHLPVLDNLLPGRLSLMVAFGLAFLLAVAADDTLFSSPVRKPLGTALVVLGLVSFVPPLPFPVVSTSVPAYFTSLSGARRLPPGTVALVGPYIDNGFEDAAPMLWQADADFHFSLIDGDAITADASGHATFLPGSPVRDAFHTLQVDGVPPPETAATRSTLLAQLRQDKVTVVIVGPMEHRDAAVSFIDWLLEGEPPHDFQGVSLWSVPG